MYIMYVMFVQRFEPGDTRFTNFHYFYKVGFKGGSFIWVISEEKCLRALKNI